MYRPLRMEDRRIESSATMNFPWRTRSVLHCRADTIFHSTSESGIISPDRSRGDPFEGATEEKRARVLIGSDAECHRRSHRSSPQPE